MWSNAVRTQLLTSCVRRHVTRQVTYTKILPRGEYFCVVLGGGHFRSVTDSRKKTPRNHSTLITTQRVEAVSAQGRSLKTNTRSTHALFSVIRHKSWSVRQRGDTNNYCPKQLWLGCPRCWNRPSCNIDVARWCSNEGP